jgi:hypothetical protein
MRTVHTAARLAKKDRGPQVEGIGFNSGSAVCIVFAIRFSILSDGRTLYK